MYGVRCAIYDLLQKQAYIIHLTSNFKEPVSQYSKYHLVILSIEHGRAGGWGGPARIL